MISTSYVKRRYYDMRMGGVTVSPIIQAGNFMMLVYLSINSSIPIYAFAPLFVIGMFICFTFLGQKFRTIQLPTDETMRYEKNIEHARATLIMLKAIQRTFLTSDPNYRELQESIEYHQRIIDNGIIH